MVSPPCSDASAHGVAAAHGGHDAAHFAAVSHLVDLHAGAQELSRQGGPGGEAHRQDDVVGGDEKAAALSEAIKNPDCPWRYRADQGEFDVIPGSPIAYWLSDNAISSFVVKRQMGEFAKARSGLKTGNNDAFIRVWWEVRNSHFSSCTEDAKQTMASSARWFPHNKGGDYRKWYGNRELVVDYQDNGKRIREYAASTSASVRFSSSECYFHEGITWTALTSGENSFRFSPEGCLFDSNKGPMLFCDSDDLLFALGFLNSSVASLFLKALNPSLSLQNGDMDKLPFNISDHDQQSVSLSRSCVELSVQDYNAFETSWDFSTHPLTQPGEPLIKNQFFRWQQECDGRFGQLKANEEELNRIFARIYGMEGEVPIEVPDDKVSVRRADLVRDVKSLISYGVGCIFGRYSTSAPGLVLADAQQTVDDFTAKVPEASFVPAKTNVLPITNVEDFSFADDAARVFRAWLADTYGSDTLDDNISFIENALGKDLRTYFAKDFYKDHCAAYQVTGSGKRPIYWLFASPRGSFQALVYMHRMTRDTVSVVLTEYVRPFRAGLAIRAAELAATGNARDASKVNRYRQMVAEVEQWERDVLYPLSQQHVEIDLDDGVKVNYKKFGRALVKVQGLS